MFKKVLQTIAAAMTLCLTMHLAMASEIVKVPTAWLGEHEAFLMWYAKEKGWDAEAGLDIQMQLFDSGPDILNALPSGKWVYAGMGAVPAMLGNLRYDIHHRPRQRRIQLQRGNGISRQPHSKGQRVERKVPRSAW